MLYFRAFGLNGNNLYSWDGDTALVAATISPSQSPTPWYPYLEYKDKLYFQASDGVTGFELWSYDGTSTSLVADIWPGFSGSIRRTCEQAVICPTIII